MRQITRLAADAFIKGHNFGSSNTTVGLDANGVVRMFLHGNLIAEQNLTGELRMTLAGWNTPTTRERLNGLLEVLGKTPGLRFCQKNFDAHYGAREIESDEWITIT